MFNFPNCLCNQEEYLASILLSSFLRFAIYHSSDGSDILLSFSFLYLHGGIKPFSQQNWFQRVLSVSDSRRTVTCHEKKTIFQRIFLPNRPSWHRDLENPSIYFFIFPNFYFRELPNSPVGLMRIIITAKVKISTSAKIG